MLNNIVMALIVIVFLAFMGKLAWHSYRDFKNHEPK